MTQRRDFNPDYSNSRIRTQRGTHAMGGFAGTISFGQKFSGTPTVLVAPLSGSSSFGNTISLRAPTIHSGSFTYIGSPGHGTFNWVAIGL
jgi:hypothetical protein